MADWSSRHARKPAPISIGKRNLGKVTPVTWEWQRLGKRLENVFATDETWAEYQTFTADRKNEIKNRKGYFYGGLCEGGLRRADAIKERWVLTLDLDKVTPQVVGELEAGVHPLCRYEFFAHTTRSHTAEAPRYRIALLADRGVVRDEFEAVTRLLAHIVDPDMKMVDRVSWRWAQLMYWPTCSSDMIDEFNFFHNSGALVDVDELLEGWEHDWRDYALLPRDADEDDHRQRAKKAERPREKKGIIGAFCRTYDVEDAIEKFDLPYIKSDIAWSKPRYTYTAGSGFNGAVVEDDGDFLYSNHGTDSVSERLVNAWDLVRIHRFVAGEEGNLDADVKDPDTAPTKLPSHKAMVELAMGDAAVKKELAAEQYDVAAMFEDLPADAEIEPAPDPDFDLEAERLLGFTDLDADDDVDALLGPQSKKPETHWMADLEYDNFGRIMSNLYNTTLILHKDQRLYPAVEFNEFLNVKVTRKPIQTKMALLKQRPPRDLINGDRLEDKHLAAFRLVLEAPNGPGKPGWGMKITDRDLKDALETTADHRPFHPVREFLAGLKWDGRHRVETLWCDYLGAEDTAYHRETALKFCVAAVARAFEPGHKFDFVPIFEGLQGKRKSTFIQVLAMDWFGELKGDFKDDKHMVEQMMGCWIMELPELSTVHRSAIEDVKAFVAALHSTVRLSYGHLPKFFPRQTVFMGTTNKKEYLLDNTGNRRWWPVETSVDFIDTDKLIRERNQVWAEAKMLYDTMRRDQPRGMLPLFLTGEAHIQALEVQEEKRQKTEVDMQAGQIALWLDTPVTQDVIEGHDSPFENLDRDPDMDPDMLVMRQETCLAEIWNDCFGSDRKPTRAESLSLAEAMRMIGGWVADKKISRTKRFGPQQVWRRDRAVR